jgi:lipopolysaccharide export system permease protein
VLVVIAGVMLVVWPWSVRQSNDLRQRFEQRSDVMRASPGQFQTSADGHRVFFVEKAGSAQAGGGRNVFILNDLGTKESVAVSQSGKLESDGKDRFLVLDSGHMQQVDKTSGEHTHIEFQHYRVHAGESSGGTQSSTNPAALDTPELILRGGAANMGEMTWRLGLIFGAGNLMLMGISLSASNPRRASNWSLLFALLAFISYYNVLNLSRAWVASGKVNIVVALVAVHGLAFLVAVGLLWWRDHATVIHPLRLFTRRTAA